LAAVEFGCKCRYALGSAQTEGIEAKFLDHESLDKVGDGVRAMQKALGPTVSAELWAGETAAANNGGKEGVTDTFLDSFWYADQLGQMARTGVKVFQRQVGACRVMWIGVPFRMSPSPLAVLSLVCRGAS
jgi:hypothetical protein